MTFGLEQHSVALFLLAVLFLFLGHAVRVRRWKLLLPPSQTHTSSPEFAALSVGYVLNFILPLKAGELVRCVIYSFLAKKDLGASISSVLIERATDVVVWVCIVGLTALLAIPSWEGATLADGFNIITAGTAAVILLAWSIGKATWSRRALNKVTIIFNDEIRFTLHHWFWTLSETFQRLLRQPKQFFVHTALMWSFYLIAYVILARCLEMTVAEMTSVFFAAPWAPTAWTAFHEVSMQRQIAITLFAVGPVAFIACYVFISRKYKVRPRTIVQWFSDPALFLASGAYRRQHYINEEQYRGFLRRTFSGDSTLLAQFDNLRTEDNTVLHRVFHGGSDALTALVQIDDALVVRKFALGAGRDKLALQCQWLKKYRSELPLVRVANERESSLYFSYDMPYLSGSREFFEVIHTSSHDISWKILKSVLNKISHFHSLHSREAASSAIINEYVETKLRGNFEKITELAPLLFQEEAIVINGVQINTRAIRDWICSEQVVESFRTRTSSLIHGDLTIENVLVNEDFEDGWFLIDPNVGNLFESPLIDYAKLLQSLHLGYESLHRDAYCRLEENEVFVSLHRTSQYAYLCTRYTDWIRERLGEDGLREVRLHEIFHYFRLTPYKFRRSPNSGMTFAACSLILADQYLKEFGPC